MGLASLASKAGLGTKWRVEAVKLAALAVPVTVTYTLNFGVTLASVIFLGHLGAKELAAGILGSLLCNVTGVSLIIGLLSAMDTMCSQAMGAKNYRKVGFVTQRAIVLTGICVMPFLLIWAFSDRVFRLLGQEAELADLAVKYTRIRIIQAPAVLCVEALRRFLQAQQIVQPMLILSLISLPLHVLLLWLLTGKHGFIGGPMSEVLTMWFQLIALIIYTYVRKPHHQETWSGLNRKEAFSEWKPYLKLGLPSLAMLCLEWWCFEIAALGVGRIGEIPLAAHGILATLTPLLYMVPLGLNTAAATRIGTFLGDGDPASAKTSATLGAIFVTIVSAIFSLAVGLGHAVIPRIFSSDSAVVHAASRALPFLAIYTIVDFLQGYCQGVLRGTGKQTVGAIGIFIGSYGVAIPLAFSLGLETSLGLRGFWLGFGIGYSVIAAMFFVLIWRFDWNVLSQEAQQRSKTSNDSETSLGDSLNLLDDTGISSDDEMEDDLFSL